MPTPVAAEVFICGAFHPRVVHGPGFEGFPLVQVAIRE